ncbi:MAG: DUF1080 domain-containing protein [Ktedonobacteraceae bacterium]|nr:DUF1080 domain-containing protein [Ktedonobacteraceae bacterium]
MSSTGSSSDEEARQQATRREPLLAPARRSGGSARPGFRRISLARPPHDEKAQTVSPQEDSENFSSQDEGSEQKILPLWRIQTLVNQVVRPREKSTADQQLPVGAVPTATRPGIGPEQQNQQIPQIPSPVNQGNLAGFSPVPTFVEQPRQQRRSNRVVAAGLLLLATLLLLSAAVLAVSQFAFPGLQSQTGAGTAPAQNTAQQSPLFRDNFQNNVQGWNTQSLPGKFTASVGNGALTLEDNSHSMLWEQVPAPAAQTAQTPAPAHLPYREFQDFRLDVDAVLAKGDQNNGYGLFVRGTLDKQGEIASYYRFTIYGDGSYAIAKGSADANGKLTSSLLVPYQMHEAIKKGGERNHLTLIAQGPVMTFLVNGQTLSTVKDASYSKGLIAFFVINLLEAQGGAQAKFSNVAIDPVR